ncbi:putative polyketide synthase [Xylariaceae sp. FL0255]|nr:putative polyketide synthase [Xylariaceae sp. FL0255]
MLGTNPIDAGSEAAIPRSVPNMNGLEWANHHLLASDDASSQFSSRKDSLNGEQAGNLTLPSTSETDPICIVGMACRLPGGISSASDLWDFIVKQKSAQGRIPQDRFNVEGFYQAGNGESRAGVMDADGGYFCQEDIRQFDCEFFGMTPAEATYLDPQQRKLLEVVFECFENAGWTLREVSGTNTGVYVGNFTIDQMIRSLRDFDDIGRYTTTGASTTILSNRISHVFNLRGPSLTLDTACSSSMYALHLAVSALKAGECSGAIVASSNLITSPEHHYSIMKAGVLSKTSACRSFDIAADGYGRADGVNAVFLLRLSQALKHNDTIRAVIRATAVNANGRTFGLTQPSASQQEAVIRQAYKCAGLSPAHTDYVECHGTGTAVGDPIEVEAVGRCFSAREGAPLAIGSIKTNVGHSEAASGLTSLMKVALAFQHSKIPPTRDIAKLNPKLMLDSLNIEVVTSLREWPNQVRRAGINSFGFGGANAHIILESLNSFCGGKKRIKKVTAPKSEKRLLVMPLSADSRKSVTIRKHQIQSLIPQCSAKSLNNLCYTLSERRTCFSSRDFILVETIGEEGRVRLSTTVSESKPLSSPPPPIAFIFTGQGAQYLGMAEHLYRQNRVFYTSILELDEVLCKASTPPTWTFKQIILGLLPPETIHDASVSQPLCTALQIGIVNVLRAWNIYPSATIGHSSGEIAAAYASGLVSAHQAIMVAYLRGRAVKKAKLRGAMLAAGLSRESAKELIQHYQLTERICVACENSPESVTLSGSLDSVDYLASVLQSKGKFVRKLETDGHAYHSFMMKEIGKMYQDLIEPVLKPSLLPSSSCPKMLSTVFRGGHLLSPYEHTNMSEYWRANLENPVYFRAALENLVYEHNNGIHLIEIGPHHALKGPIKQVWESLKLDPPHVSYSSTLSRNQDSSLSMKELAGRLFCMGYQLHWGNVNELCQSNVELFDGLSPYPWDYSDGLTLHESRPSRELRRRRHPRHELLGSMQLAGNGVDWAWRNVVSLSETPWLSDHRIETQVVFPASGYLSMAMEALFQVHSTDTDNSHPNVAFEFRNVNIITAFVLPDASEKRAIEIHTTLARHKISGASFSEDWHEFSISSYNEDQAILHCTGTIRVVENHSIQQCQLTFDCTSFRPFSTMKFYEKLDHDGVCFGPYFKSLETLLVDDLEHQTEARATTQLWPNTGVYTTSQGLIHPIVIDACIQTGIMARAKSDTESLEAYLPKSISHCLISTYGSPDHKGSGTVEARSKQTGISTCQVDARLLNSGDRVLAQFTGIKLSRYSAKSVLKSQETAAAPRSPFYRVHWRPDIRCLQPGAECHLREYIVAFMSRQHPDALYDGVYITIGALLDLAGHANPSMTVLEVQSLDRTHETEYLLSILGKKTHTQRYKCWHRGQLRQDGIVFVEDAENSPYATIIIPEHATSLDFWERPSPWIKPWVDQASVIVTRTNSSALRVLGSSDFVVLEVDDYLTLAVRPQPFLQTVQGAQVLIVSQRASPGVATLGSAIESYIRERSDVHRVTCISLDEIKTINLDRETLCVFLLEVEHEILATITHKDLSYIQYITNNVRKVLWLNGANMLAQPNPSLSLAAGLSRAIMLEQPSLQFFVLDIGSMSLTQYELHWICKHVSTILFSAESKSQDSEFIMANHLLYISRFAPDPRNNFRYQERLGMHEPLQMKLLSEVNPIKLSLGRIGILDTIHFKEVREPSYTIPRGYVEIEIKALSLNAKDVYAIYGRVETHAATTACEFSGVIKSIGPGETNNLRPGDRVVVLAPIHASTIVRVPAWSAHKILPGESFTTMASIPVAYATALYSLIDLAQLRRGESVLVHSGAGAVGLAAISIAQNLGAIIYTTVSSSSKQEFLSKRFGIPDSHIFHSRNVDFAGKIQSITQGKGVNVVLNSLTGDMMHAGWRCLAKFGRFVEIGKRELLDAGRLDMDMFLRNATFTAFDLEELFYHEEKHYRDILAEKFKMALQLYRSRAIEAVPTSVFGADKVEEAFRYFSTGDRVGKVVVSFENTSIPVPVAPAIYSTVFDLTKTYLMIGCLGGLGRSLCRWMVTRGARNFVFLSRTGADRSEARKLITFLEGRGATAVVVRGDVSMAEDVENAIKAAKTPIGGVVQGAMGLREELFTNMSSDAWHTALQPKFAGTWNIHEALKAHDNELDFFLLLSSVNGTVGSATESNYCSANAFLDAFAHWRNSIGKPATSVGLGMISEVGYLHENPAIEASLLRRGITPLNQKDFLQVIDLALAQGQSISNKEALDILSHESCHIVTGLESTGFRYLEDQGYDVTYDAGNDRRASILTAKYEREKEMIHRTREGAGSRSDLKPHCSWWDMVPQKASDLFIQESAAPTFGMAILGLAKKKLSGLILMRSEKIVDTKPLTEFGFDSMVAAEFRRWFWDSLDVDIPYLDLLGPQNTLASVVKKAESILESFRQGASCHVVQDQRALTSSVKN